MAIFITFVGVLEAQIGHFARVSNDLRSLQLMFLVILMYYEHHVAQTPPSCRFFCQTPCIFWLSKSKTGQVHIWVTAVGGEAWLKGIQVTGGGRGEQLTKN